MNKSQIINFFKSLRNKEHSSDDLCDMLIKRTKYFDEDKILQFQLELNNYLIKEKELMRNTFGDDEINKAILKRKENNLPIPYRGGLGNTTPKNSFIHLNIEELMFPNEFKCLSELQTQINIFPFDKYRKTHIEFSEFFNSPISSDKLSWLKQVFNKNESQKEYAIMFCLLSQYKLIFIGDKKLVSLFRSWYDFIEKKHPTNFKNIYHYIPDRSFDGLVFININDPIYGLFEKRLKTEFIETP